MTNEVKLIGLDFGTTTSSAVVAAASLSRNAVTGRMELTELRPCFRSELVFTPLVEESLDVVRLAKYVDDWIASASLDPAEVFGGGALLTGLTAQRENADALLALVRRRFANALVASANDPHLESWLAFMGSCAAVSRQHPERWFLNLDIGGGTTNLALGRNGVVHSTGHFSIGARHVRVEPGSYRIVGLSPLAPYLFEYLGIVKGLGQDLDRHDVDVLAGYFADLLVAAVEDDEAALEKRPISLFGHAPYRLNNESDVVVTFSGGVGELVYQTLEGTHAGRSPTCFGDLGIDFAIELVRRFPYALSFRPEGGGRATVYGLLRHGTQVSGNTLFLSPHAKLPLSDVPVFGTLTDRSSAAELVKLVDWSRRSVTGGALRIALSDRSAEGLRRFGTALGDLLTEQGFPAEQPLVLLVKENIGKVLGHYVTAWGRRPFALVVIDEVAVPDAQYVHVGSCRDQVVPVSFYGLQP